MDVKMFASVFFALVLHGLMQSNRLWSIEGIVVLVIIFLALRSPRKDQGTGGS